MKILKRIIIIILSILLGVLVLYNIYNIVCIKMLKQDVASINGYAILEVISGSMEPTIHVGDMIIVDTKDNNYNEDDIVTFKDKNMLITHRIVSVTEDEIITKGDGNNALDDAITSSDIIGKYVFKINSGGKILAALKSPLTMIMIFVVGVLFCIFISMDKNGNIILDDDEVLFMEYLKEKKKEKKSNKKANIKDK